MDGFGYRLKKLRQEKDITQADLAKEVGVVSSAIGKYERLPNAAPSVDALMKIADYFDVSIDYLLKGEDAMNFNVENNISGQVGAFTQTNHGGVVVNGETLSPEIAELLRIYGTLSGRDRLKLLNYAVKLEDEKNG
jgi:transcriptional regulator with XRE-family HTH domain